MVAETMNKAKLIKSVGIPLVAIVGFWIGGHAYFRTSSDWSDIQALIVDDPGIRQRVGEVKEISVRIFPFMYRFSGDSADATIRIGVVGSTGTFTNTIRATRRNGMWILGDVD